MPEVATDTRTWESYESIADVILDDIVRMKEGQIRSGYDDERLPSVLLGADLVVHSRDSADNTMLVGPDARTTRWVKLHQVKVAREAAPSASEAAPSTGAWATITGELQVGDEVRPCVSLDADNTHGAGTLRSHLGAAPHIVSMVTKRTSFKIESGNGWDYHPGQFERRVAVAETTATWENFKDFTDACVGDVVRFRADQNSTGYDDRIRDEWRGLELTIDEVDRGDDTVRVGSTNDSLFDAGRHTWVRVSSLERRTTVAAAAASAEDKPEMYTEEWFNTFMDRALAYANRHDMCDEVERFLESEGIDHKQATKKTVVVKVNVEVEIEVDLSGRRAYDESDLKYAARQRVERAIAGMDTSDIPDATGEAVDAVRIGTPSTSAEATVKAK